MAHVRRTFVDVHRAQRSTIADEAIRRIAQFYEIEKGRGGGAGQACRDPPGESGTDLR